MTDEVKLWAQAKRDKVKRQLDQEAENLARRVKADAMVVIAFWADGERGAHCQDGFTQRLPADLLTIYMNMVKAHNIMRNSPDGEDVVVQ